MIMIYPSLSHDIYCGILYYSTNNRLNLLAMRPLKIP